MSRNKPKSRVKTARGRKGSSTRWLNRQLNDPYVELAAKHGYRSRAAFKIREIDEKIGIFKPGLKVVDLGSAPGGWSQVAVEKGCRPVIALDLLEMEAVPGAEFVCLDFMDDQAPQKLKDMLGGPADIVMSDMAPNTTGHKQTDHLRIMAVVEAAAFFAEDVLAPGGTFIAKVFQGGAEQDLLASLKKTYKSVRHIKPPASRKESAEQYLVATGFKE